MTVSFLVIILFWLPVLLYSASSLFFYVGLHRRQAGSNKKKHFISVIIAARNEEENIPALLDSLIKQEYPSDRYEVIVVDDKSTDSTAETVKEYSQRSEELRLLRVEETPDNYSPKKYALTVGIKEARGDIILTVDADCIVRPTWVGTMNSYFTEDVGMVVGYSGVSVTDRRSWLQKWQAFDFLALMAANEGALNHGIPLASSGQNLGFRKSAFQEVGGYDSIAERATGDDVLLLQLIRRKTEFEIVFAGTPEAYNNTSPELTLKDLLHQRIRWASDAPIQLWMDPAFFAYLVAVFSMYVVFIGGILYALFNPGFWIIVGAGYLVKALSEFVLLNYATQIYARRDLMGQFPVWTLLQIPYIIVTGLGGVFFNYSWKGRTRKEVKQIGEKEQG